MKDNRVGVKAARITVIGVIIASIVSGIFLLISQKRQPVSIIVEPHNIIQNEPIKRFKDATERLKLLAEKIKDWDYYFDQELTKPKLIDYIKEIIRPAVINLQKEYKYFPKKGSAEKLIKDIKAMDDVIEAMIKYCSDDSLQTKLNDPKITLEDLKSYMEIFISASDAILELIERKIAESIN